MVTVTVPKLGLTMTEATLASWLVDVGAKVSKDAPLAEIETDKISHTVLAPCDGVIAERFAAEGDTVEVLAALCTIQ